MSVIEISSMQFGADLTRIALVSADISGVIVGVDVGFAGIGGVQLLGRKIASRERHGFSGCLKAVSENFERIERQGSHTVALGQH